MNSPKPKLLVTASTFPRWEGDTEPRFVLDLSKAMTKYFDVTVLAPAAVGAKTKEEMESVHVIRYHYFPIHRWETLCYPGAIVPRIREKKIRALQVPFLFFSLWRHLRRLLPEFDLVHGLWLIPQGILQSFFKKPYLVTGHGADVTSMNSGVMKKLKIRCLENAGAVTVVSEALKKNVSSLCKVDHLSVISMGCDTGQFGRQYRKENFFGQNGKKVVLFVGRLAEKKGVPYLIEAVRDLDVKLVIVGSGPMEAELRKMALPMGEKVFFAGPKTHTALKEIYASADIMVVPSITAKDGDQEGLGLVIIEAMASGLPVIASDSGGISSVLKDGVNGCLVPEKDSAAIADRIRYLITHESCVESLVENAYQTAAEYDYQNIAKSYWMVCRQILENA